MVATYIISVVTLAIVFAHFILWSKDRIDKLLYEREQALLARLKGTSPLVEIFFKKSEWEIVPFAVEMVPSRDIKSKLLRFLGINNPGVTIVRANARHNRLRPAPLDKLREAAKGLGLQIIVVGDRTQVLFRINETNVDKCYTELGRLANEILERLACESSADDFTKKELEGE
ncbi:MAG: hypothetical protein KAV98_04660 [Dehalococcoidia bacterium]|nr:hypothetical protein [Dehalococcoidia bacterium]